MQAARARSSAQSHRPRSAGYQYFDWTKGGNGPWSDVYYRNDHKVIVGAILRDV